MVTWEEVSSLLPARVHRTTPGSRFWVQAKYPLLTGLKCLVYGEGAVQELFIITSNPQAVFLRIQEHFPQK